MSARTCGCAQLTVFAATGDVLVLALVRHQRSTPNCRFLEAEHGAGPVALGRVIEHDVENDLDPRGVQRLDHGLEFHHRVRDGIVIGRREPGQRIVAQ